MTTTTTTTNPLLGGGGFDEEDPDGEVGGLIQDDDETCGFSDVDSDAGRADPSYPAADVGDLEEDTFDEPLVPGNAEASALSGRDGIGDDPPSKKTAPASLTYTETVEFLKLVWPVAITCVVEFVPCLASIVIVGRYCDRNALDGAALATMYFNVAALSIGVGLTTALDTLAPQAVGAGEDKLLGVYVQRGGAILAVVLVPIVLVACFSDSVLKGLGQPDPIATRAGAYVRWMLPSLPSYWAFELLRKVFHAYGVVEPLVAIGAVATAIHCVLAYCFVRGIWKLPWVPAEFDGSGFVGAALARSISGAAALMCLGLYSKWSGLSSRFWGGWAPVRSVVLAKTEVATFLKLGGAGCAAICFEWWAFELLALLAGLLPRRSDVFIGAHAVLFNLAAFLYMGLSGCASAASVRTGLALGAGRPDRAIVATRVARAAGLVVGVANAIILYVGRDALPELFDRNDRAVRRAATVAMPALAAYQIFDAHNAVVGGIMRGAGRQTAPAVISFVAFYVAGNPAAAVFAFVLGWNLVGLWLGLTGGLCVASFMYAACLWRFDYAALADEAVRLSLESAERSLGGLASAGLDTAAAEATAYRPLADGPPDGSLGGLVVFDAVGADGPPPSNTTPASGRFDGGLGGLRPGLLREGRPEDADDVESLYSCRSSGLSLKPVTKVVNQTTPGGGPARDSRDDDDDDDDDDDCASQHTTDTMLDVSSVAGGERFGPGGARFAAVDEAGEGDEEDEVTM